MRRKVLCVGALLTLGACHGETHAPSHPAPQLPTRSVHVQTVEEVGRALTDEVVGTVRSRNATSVSASIMGTVKSVKGVGSKVKAGDILVRLHAGEMEAAAAQAKATHAQAVIEMKRAEQLKASHSIPSAQYDAVASRLQVTEAALREAEVMASYTVLRAPFSGVVTEKLSSVGDLATPGKPLLMLESRGALRLEAAVPEGISHLLHLGDVLPVEIDALHKTLDARVSELSPSADSESRTLLVKLDLPELPELRAGMFGRLGVVTGEERAVVVPDTAVLHRGQLELVFIADKNTAKLRLVRSARGEAGKAIVLAGLEGGERVVTDHLAELSDGQPLEIKP